MKRFHIFLIFFLLILSACLPPTTTPIIPTHIPPVQVTETPVQPTSTPLPDFTPTPMMSVKLHRGVNFGNMLEAPNEGDWGLTVQEEYFDAVKDAGFDFIRLPIRWNAHADMEYPYAVDPAFFAHVDEIVGWAQKRNLAIIIDFHHYEELMTDPWSHKDRYLGIWKQVAEHYKDYPANVLFELLNEPNTTLDAQIWNEYSKAALSVVRETNPTRDVVIGPVNWNAYDWLSTLDVPNDEHLIVTFHYYLPFQFTHQGAEWIGAEAQSWLGTQWGSDAEKAKIASHFNSVVDWSARHGNVCILLGEFGAYSKASQDSRVRWTAFVREQAESHGFAWAYWEFGAGFGVYDPNAKTWRQDLLKALIP